MLDDLIAQFESAWRRGERPDLDRIIESASEDVQRDALLLELVHIELEQRLAAGEAARVEEYLARYPQLAEERQVVLGLVRSEYEMRRRTEPALSLDEYINRFPRCRDLLPTEMQRPPRPRPGRVALRLNCPHCQSPIEIVDDRQDAGEVMCPSCGSSFKLAEDRTYTWKPEKLPRLGKFELLEAVGRGAFGTVYRARDTELDRIVAIKMPRNGSLATQEDEDRFIREARSIAQLRHPHIVSVYETGRSEHYPYIVSEFVQGITLADQITARRLTPREAAKAIATIAEALQSAHDQGVVHRDVKPSNIMLDDHDEPHLMDFGLAKRDAGEITMTVEGQVLGTPAYMSPEQARGEGHQVDGRSDVYSLGVILYELLTGELPFRGNQRMLLHQVLKDEPRSPRSLNDRIPRDLETICLKGMTKEPGQRYQTAKDIAADLLRWLEGRPIVARPVGRLSRGMRWCKRNPLVAGLSAVVALSLATGTITSSFFAIEVNKRADDALIQRERAEDEKQHALYQLNRNRIFLAYREWEAANVKQAKSLLEGCPSSARFWEWRYLCTLLDAPDHISSLDNIRAFAITRDASTVLIATSAREVKCVELQQGHTLWVAQLPAGYAAVDITLCEPNYAAVILQPTTSALPWRITLLSPTVGTVLASLDEGARWIKDIRASAEGAFTLLELDWERRVYIVRVLNAITATASTLAEMPADTGRGWMQVAISHDASRAILPAREFGPGAFSGMRLVDLATGKEDIPKAAANLNDATVVSFASGDRQLIIGRRTGEVDIWSENAEVKQKSWTVGEASVTAIDSNQQWLASGGEDRVVRLWSRRTGELLGKYRGATDAIRAIRLAGDRIVALTERGALFVWNANRRHEYYELGANEPTLAMMPAATLTPDGNHLICGGIGLPTAWDLKRNERLDSKSLITLPSWAITVRGTDAMYSALDSMPDNACVVAGLQSGRVVLFDWKAGKSLRTIVRHPTSVEEVSVSADGQYVAVNGAAIPYRSGTKDGPSTLAVYKIQNGAELLHLVPNKRTSFNSVMCCRFCALNSTLVVSDGESIGLYDFAGLEPVKLKEVALKTAVKATDIAWRRDGQGIALSFLEQPGLMLFNLKLEQVPLSLQSDGRINSIAFLERVWKLRSCV